MSDTRKKKKKKQDIVESMLNDIIRKSLKTTIDQALNEILKDFK